MTNSTNEVKLVVDCQNQLGESPIWDDKKNCLWWTDILSEKLYQFFPETSQLNTFTTPERLCSFGLNSRDGLIASFESGFAFNNPESGAIQWLHDIEPNLLNTRMNDGRCDRFGRFFAGSMVEHNEEVSRSNHVTANLYRLDKDHALSRLETNIQISNSLCWSPDNKHMYFADSAARTIWRYDYDGATGDISNRTVFAQTSGNCFPDGSAVDSQGYLWNAQWGASQLVRYSPDGRIDNIITMPVIQPSCVAFGGENLATLFITSARDGLASETLQAQQANGSVFSIETQVPGLPEGRFGT